MSHILNPIIIFSAKYLYLVIFIFAFIWFLNQSRSTQNESLLLICICLPLVFIASYIAGRLYYDPRPFVLEHFKPLIYHKPDNGFPSHHTLLAALTSAIIFIFNKRTGFLLWVLTFFIGFSRVYCGVHHLIDIAAGVLIPVILVTLIYFLYVRRYSCLRQAGAIR